MIFIVKVSMYPNYWNYYYYDEGENVIRLVRKVGEEVIYRHWMNFDSVDEAKAYFENEL